MLRISERGYEGSNVLQCLLAVFLFHLLVRRICGAGPFWPKPEPFVGVTRPWPPSILICNGAALLALLLGSASPSSSLGFRALGFGLRA